MTTILVTGSSGAIGSAIVEAWARLGVFTPSWGDRKRVVTDRMDTRTNLCESDEVAELFQRVGPSVVIHAAASRYQPGDVHGFTRAADDLQMTLNVLREAKEAQVEHFVFLSSSTVYETVQPAFYHQQFGMLVESMTDIAAMPRSPIAFSKRAGELAVEAWAKETGAAHTIWRLFNVVSPREPHDRPAHVHVDLYRKIVIEQQPTISVPQSAFRAFVWVDEVADAIARYLDQARGTLNLGSTDFVRIRDLANTMVSIAKQLKLVPESYVPIVEMIGGPDDKRVPNIDKVRQLGWHWAADYAQCMELFMRGKHGL